MEQSSSWETNSSSGGQEISCFLWNPKGQYGIYKCPPRVPTLSQFSSSCPPHGIPSGLFPSGFLYQNSVCICVFFNTYNMPRPSRLILVDFCRNITSDLNREVLLPCHELRTEMCVAHSNRRFCDNFRAVWQLISDTGCSILIWVTERSAYTKFHPLIITYTCTTHYHFPNHRIHFLRRYEFATMSSPPIIQICVCVCVCVCVCCAYINKYWITNSQASWTRNRWTRYHRNPSCFVSRYINFIYILRDYCVDFHVCNVSIDVNV
jgi:hypothetical protein